MIGKKAGKINTATGRKQREMGGILKKGSGGIRRQNGKPAEKRVTWRQRTTVQRGKKR